MQATTRSDQNDRISLSESQETETTSAELLALFVNQRNENAFELLIRRFGPLVYGVCRRVMKNHHDAEEVFQETFLTLARNARNISCPQGLSVWLHRVAFHAALRAKSKIQARHQKEMEMVNVPEPAVTEQYLWEDLEGVLDQELNRLPEKYRLPILLCDVEGKSYQTAAVEIGCPPGTIASRLSHARELLASRLTRRGVVLTSATLTVLLVQNAATAAVPAGLITTTVTAASTVSVLPTTLAGATASKVTACLKWVTESLGLGKAALVGVAGAGVFAAGVALQEPPNKEPPPQNQPPLVAQPVPVKPKGILAEIVATYRKHDESFQTLRLEYDEHMEYLQDPEVLYQTYQIYPSFHVGHPSTEIVVSGEKFGVVHDYRGINQKALVNFLQEKYPDRVTTFPHLNNELSFQEIQKEIPNVPLESHMVIRIYDGTRFYDNNFGEKQKRPKDSVIRPVIRICSSNQVSPRFFEICPFFLDGIFSGSNHLQHNSVLSNNSKPVTKYRLADLLENGDWKVQAEQADLDGTHCVILEGTGGVRLWLDRLKGYAPRRYLSPLGLQLDYSDFRQVSDEFYIPGKTERTVRSFEPKYPRDPEAVPLPTIKYTYLLTKMVVNQPVDERDFRLIPEPGTIVYDYTKQPLDSQGNRIDISQTEDNDSAISYVQSENPQDIHVVAEKATPWSPADAAKIQASRASNPETNTSPVVHSTLFWFVIVNLGLMIVVIGIVLWRRMFREV